MFKDPRPLSERFDLTYVTRRSWPNRHTRLLSFALMIVLGGYIALLTWTGDNRAYSSGDLTHAHALFAQDCAQCHQADPSHHRYWLPAQDAACLQCHAAPAHPDPHGHILPAGLAPVSDRLGQVSMASNCAACHTEHRGADYDLKRIDDKFCVQCHQDLEAYASGVLHTTETTP